MLIIRFQFYPKWTSSPRLHEDERKRSARLIGWAMTDVMSHLCGLKSGCDKYFIQRMKAETQYYRRECLSRFKAILLPEVVSIYGTQVYLFFFFQSVRLFSYHIVQELKITCHMVAMMCVSHDATQKRKKKYFVEGHGFYSNPTTSIEAIDQFGKSLSG